MEIKHTVEILTKDIQEIEKLVRNLNNSPVPPRIELDLALSKLRYVYELLSMIRTDIDEEKIQLDADEKQMPHEIVTEDLNAIPDEFDAEPDIIETALQDIDSEPEVKETASVEKTPSPELAPVEVQESEPVITEEVVKEVQKDVPTKKKEAGILAEKFNNDKSINEKIASSKLTSDISSKITGQPIDNIGRNIGINDRFQIIRELFSGDNESYSQLIKQLDSSQNLLEALALLESSLADYAEHESYLLLDRLVRRKYISA